MLGEYATYAEAQKIVDKLAKADFAVKGLAIVGSDLTTVERITGRLSYGRAALAGAGSGAWLGLFIGLVLFLFSPAPEFSFILAPALIGAGFGMTFGIASYAINRRRRDFSSTHQVLAGSYRIIIDPNQTARARQVLAGSTWPPVDAAPAAEKPNESVDAAPAAEKPNKSVDAAPAEVPAETPAETPAEQPGDTAAEKREGSTQP